MSIYEELIYTVNYITHNKSKNRVTVDKILRLGIFVFTKNHNSDKEKHLP